MKTKALIVVLVFLLISGTQAQDFKISFKSSSQDHPVNNVEIINISKGTSITIPGSGILNLTTEITSGLNHYEHNNQMIIHPNPTEESSVIQFFNPLAGTVQMNIYDFAGSLVYQLSNYLSHGLHSYRVSDLMKGIYLIIIQTPSGLFSGKLISVAPGGNSPQLSYIGEVKNKVSSMRIKNNNAGSIAMHYNQGDRIHFKGKSGNRTFIHTWSPTKDSIIEFDFVPCVDGDNNHYPIVQIGNQLWMAENLKTTKFSDETPINYYERNWRDKTTAEYVWYNNDISWKDVYGALYSWYAIDSKKDICPIGWHVPSNQDWAKLEQFICSQMGNTDCDTHYPMELTTYRDFDERRTEAFTLRSCRQINSEIVGDCSVLEHPRWDEGGIGWDEYGFTALPGGSYSPFHGSYGLGQYAKWWTSDLFDDEPRSRSIFKNYGDIDRSFMSTSSGVSVRCVRDIDLDVIYKLDIVVAPYNSGVVMGAGSYEMGAKTELSAITEVGYKFSGWILDGILLSKDVNFIFKMPAIDVTLIASFEEELDDHQPGEGVTDIDGNFYPSVIIGNQEWLTENLKTTRYRNGISIEYPADDITWANNTTGAYSWNENNMDWKSVYGGLYNWYAVNNANGLCPTGWSIPERHHWNELIMYVANNGFEGDMFDTNAPGMGLKSCRQVSSVLGEQCETTEHPRWNANETYYGVDAFGFSALPGGIRREDGTHLIPGTAAIWWTSTEYTETESWGLSLSSNYNNVMPYISFKNEGLSIRCFRPVKTP